MLDSSPAAILLFTIATTLAFPASPAAAPSEAGPLTALAATIDRPTAGAIIERPETLRLGRGELEPLAGSKVQRLLCGGEPCGLLVTGPARFRYTVEDRFSRPVASRNFDRLSSVELAAGRGGGAPVAATTLTGAVLWGWELAATTAAPDEPASRSEGDAAAGDDAAARGDGPGNGLPAWAAEILDKSLFSPPSNDLLAAGRLPGEGEIYALLHGDEDWLLAVDPPVARMELLWRIDALSRRYEELKGEHVLRELAAQPIDRDWWDPVPAPVVATRERIRVDNPAGSTVTVRTKTRLEATRDGVGLWRARLVERVFDNRDREIPNRVESVTVGGRPVEFVHRDHELLVPIDPPLAAGAVAEVEVVSGGDLAIRPGQDSYWYLLGPWYPSPPLNGERAAAEIEVRVPEPYTPFASGTTLERGTEEGHSLVRTCLEHPTQFPVVVAGKYEVFEEEKDGLTCRVASYAGGKEEASRRLIGNLFAAVDFYQQLFNVPYPFAEVDVVEINSWGFGVAPAGVIFITQEAYDPLGDITSRFFSQGVNERYVHEVAHAWWGHVSRASSYEEAWLNESFAEYSAALCLQAMRGGGKKGDREFRKLLRGWISRTRQIGDGGSIYLADHLGADEGEIAAARDRNYLLYSKGPLVLHALRQELGRRLDSEEQGDRYFFALLRTFLQHVEPRWGESRHLVGILDQITGQPWQPWFERYVYGTEIPEVDD